MSHIIRIVRNRYTYDRTGGTPLVIDATDEDVCYITDGFSFQKIEEIPFGSSVELYHTGGSTSLMPMRFHEEEFVPYDPPGPITLAYHRYERDAEQDWHASGGHGTSCALGAQRLQETPPFAITSGASYKAIPGTFQFNGDSVTKTIEVRELALENLKVDKKVVNPESISPLVTIRGDIRVYPNPVSNGLSAWTPENDLEWQVTLRSPFLSDIVLNGTIASSSPDSSGYLGELVVTWDPTTEDNLLEADLDIQAGLKMAINNGGHTVTRPAFTHCFVCRTCKDELTGEVHATKGVSVFDSQELAVSLGYSGFQSENAPASMGYGWFSTESCRVVELEDESLVYCDGSGGYRRWRKLGPDDYEAVFPDNTLSISVNSSDPDAQYTVTWRDSSKRIFDEDGKLRQKIDRLGRVTSYDKSTSYLAVTDSYGRTVYHHFEGTEVQPRVINDNINPLLGRRYVLDYYMDGTNQLQLKSVTDPVGDATIYVYDGSGRLIEQRDELDNHHRSVFYTYDASETGRMATMKVSSKLLQADPAPDIVTDLFQVSYFYNEPVHYAGDPYEIVDYLTTKTVTEDLMVPDNPAQTQAKPRTKYVAFDSLLRVIGDFEVVEDDLTDESEISESTHIINLHKYNDPSDPDSDSDDPWLRVETLQVNKLASTFFKYTSRGNLRSIIQAPGVDEAAGNETLITYVEQTPSHELYSLFPDLVTEVRRPAPDLAGAPTTFLPPTKFTYDYDALTETSKGNLIGIEDPDGYHTHLRYNSDGKIDRVINRRGFKSYLVYDSFAHLSEVHVQKSESPSPSITELASENASDFRKTMFSYEDGYDNLTKVEDATGNTITVVYDDVNRPTLITTVPGTTPVNWGFEYFDRVLKKVTLPDSSGPSGSHTDRKSILEYDSAGRPLAVKRKDSVNTSEELRVGFAYDGFSQLRSLIRLKSGVERGHTAEYDRQGRTIKTTDAKNSDPSVVDPKFSTAAYEPFCVGFATTSARGVRRIASFDSLCRLTGTQVGAPAASPLEVTNPSETRNFDYDDLGRLLGTTQTLPPRYGQARFGDDRYGVSPVTRGYEYDSLDRVTKVTFEDSKTIEYFYDEEGNVIEVTENASGTSKTTLFSYFGDNRLHQVTYVRGSGNQVFTYAYDAGGRPSTLTYPASTGIIAEFEGPTGQVGWDGNGQLKHLRYRKGTDIIRRFEFDYDAAGNRIRQLDVVDIASPLTQRAVEWVYGYDWLDRLETVKKAEAATVGALGALQLVSVYSYDAADNRTEFQVPNLDPDLTETFKSYFDDADNITFIEKKVGSGAFATIETFASDDDGNLITRISGGVTTTYKWDDFNRLAAISTSDNSKKQTHTFGVNGFRRKKKDKDGVETTEYAAVLATAVAKSLAETVTYLMGHRLMGFEKSGNFYWFLTDALGSVRDVVDSAGAVKASYEFDPDGNKISPPNTMGVESAKTWLGGFSADDDTKNAGLYLLGQRFYDPGLGRFISRDPSGVTEVGNLFSYARSSPMRFIDRNGLQAEEPDWDKTFKFTQDADCLKRMLSAIYKTKTGGRILNEMIGTGEMFTIQVGPLAVTDHRVAAPGDKTNQVTIPNKKMILENKGTAYLIGETWTAPSSLRVLIHELIGHLGNCKGDCYPDEGQPCKREQIANLTEVLVSNDLGLPRKNLAMYERSDEIDGIQDYSQENLEDYGLGDLDCM